MKRPAAVIVDKAFGHCSFRQQHASVAEHYRLVDLATAGKGEAASALLSRHIVEWKPIFTAALAKCEANALGRGTIRAAIRSLRLDA